MSEIPKYTPSQQHAHGAQSQAVVPASPAEQAYNTAVDFFSQHLGINTEAMSEFYNKFISNNEAYKQLGLYIGVDPEELGAEAKKRFSGANTEYISQRVAMLKQIGGALESSPTLNHLHNFFTYSQRSFEAAGGSVDELSPYLKEAHEAAKKAVKDIPEYTARLQSDVMAFIYDPEIRRLTGEELHRRFTELTKIDGVGLKYSHRGWHGRLADFGIVGGLTIGTFTSLVGKLSRLKPNWGHHRHGSVTEFQMNQGNWFSRLIHGSSYDVSMGRVLKSKLNAAGKDRYAKEIQGHLSIRNINKPALKDIEALFKEGICSKQNPLKVTIGKEVMEFTNHEAYCQALLKRANASNLKTLVGNKTGRAAKKALFIPKSKALLAQAGRKAGWMMAAAAALAWGYNYLTDNPEKIKPITNTVAKLGNGAKNLAFSAGHMVKENIIPDMGILYGSPWFEEGAAVA